MIAFAEYYVIFLAEFMRLGQSKVTTIYFTRLHLIAIDMEMTKLHMTCKGLCVITALISSSLKTDAFKA
jgi:hypothetical protein